MFPDILRSLYRRLPLPHALKNTIRSIYRQRSLKGHETKYFTEASNRKIVSVSKSERNPKSGVVGLLPASVINQKNDVSISPSQFSETQVLLPPTIKLYHSHSDFMDCSDERIDARKTRSIFEDELRPEKNKAFNVPGFCSVCISARKFRVSYLYAYERNENGELLPNWRKSLVCETCGINNRVRAAVALHDNLIDVQPDEKLYVTEELTAFYLWLKGRFQYVVGSEFLGDDKDGGTNYDGIRHEDITKLSFNDNSLDGIMSFDVLEHVPDTGGALSEMMRCLKPGGFALVSAPFIPEKYETLVRAKIDRHGEVEHLLEPEYHGNPVSPGEGSLCFYHFGWDVVDQFRNAGASDAAVLSYYSSERANLGNEQLFFLAVQ